MRDSQGKVKRQLKELFVKKLKSILINSGNLLLDRQKISIRDLVLDDNETDPQVSGDTRSINQK